SELLFLERPLCAVVTGQYQLVAFYPNGGFCVQHPCEAGVHGMNLRRAASHCRSPRSCRHQLAGLKPEPPCDLVATRERILAALKRDRVLYPWRNLEIAVSDAGQPPLRMIQVRTIACLCKPAESKQGRRTGKNKCS